MYFRLSVYGGQAEPGAYSPDTAPKYTSYVAKAAFFFLNRVHYACLFAPSTRVLQLERCLWILGAVVGRVPQLAPSITGPRTRCNHFRPKKSGTWCTQI